MGGNFLVGQTLENTAKHLLFSSCDRSVTTLIPPLGRDTDFPQTPVDPFRHSRPQAWLGLDQCSDFSLVQIDPPFAQGGEAIASPIFKSSPEVFVSNQLADH
jgi:hypothetical protein